MPAAAETSDSVCGWAVFRWPVRSTTPMISPVSGSWIGAPEHCHGWTRRLKCSAEKIWTGWSTAIAVPSALVPAPCSLQSAPQTKCMFSVASITC